MSTATCATNNPNSIPIMKRKYFSNLLMGSAVVCWSVSFQPVSAGAPTTAPAAEAPALTNSIGFTVGGADVSGDDAAFQSRLQQNADWYGGISNLNWESDIGDGLSLAVEGHALFGSEDYGFLGTLTKDDVGYIQLGYKQFRTWYDDSGGFVPGNIDAWVPLYDGDDLSVDRGSVWFEAGLRKEDFPELTFRYTHDWRDGTKDSTSWAAAGGGYKNVPSLNEIDETTDTFRLDFTHTLGKTDFGGGVSYQSIDNDDNRVMRPSATAANSTAGRTINDTATYESDIWGAHLFSETRFNEKLMFGFSYNFTDIETDVGGDRPSNNTASPYALRTSQDHALFGIAGGTQGSINVLDANLSWNPIDNLMIVPRLRAEFEETDGWASHIAGVRGNPDATEAELGTALAGGNLPYAVRRYDPDGPTGPLPLGNYNVPTLVDEIVSTSNDVSLFEEAIEARYSGFENILLYGNIEFTQIDGEMRRDESATDRDVVPVVSIPGYTTDYDDRATDSEIDRQKYSIGANWYPLSGVSISAQAYYKNSDASYDNSGSEAAMLRESNYETTNFNIRLTWRALSNLTLVSRYDYQKTSRDTLAEPYDYTVSNVSYTFSPDMIESADITSNIFSQSVTWMPVERAYVQGTFSYVDSTTDTPSSGNASYYNSDSDNDYVTVSLTAGYAIDDKTDISASYNYYYADNYTIPVDPNGVASMGYGTTIEEHVFSVSLNRLVTSNMIWSLGYGYYNSNDGTYGGYNDFDAHMVSTGLQVRF
jgi:hypothetical protein